MEYPNSQNQVMFKTPKYIPIYLLSDVTQGMKSAVLEITFQNYSWSIK